RHDQEPEAVARRQDEQTLVCRRDAQRRTQFPPAQGLPAAAEVRRCARPSPRSCSTGMRCCTSRMSGPTDAPTPSGRDPRAGRSGRPRPQVLRGVRMKTPPIVSPQEWEAARQELLVKEKELTRARDALAAERRRMPWLAVDKAYQFDGPDGMASLLDLFDGRRQLIGY